MSLDITAFSNGTFVDYVDSPHFGGRGELPKSLIHIYPEMGFRNRIDGYKPGIYRIKGPQLEERFGSCHSYNVWRRILSQAIIGVEPSVVWDAVRKYQRKPFFLLIHMSDQEGSFGPRTSEKLFQQFEDVAPTIKGLVSRVISKSDINDGYTIDWWMAGFELFRRAFGLARNNGFVKFH